MRRASAALGASAALLLAAWGCGGPGDAEGPPRVAPGRQVSLEFTVTLENGEVVESNVGEAPLRVEIGSGRLLPAVEQGLAGLAAGDTRKLVLGPEQAYGAVRPELQESIARERIPADSHSVGAVVLGEAPDGSQRYVRVLEVGEDEIVLDLNHPLAGETIGFDARILAVE